MSPRQTFAALCLILAWLLAPRLARAHEADPIGVGVLERPSGEVTVRVARPAAVQRAWPIVIEPPSGCEVSGAPSERREGARVVAETRWSCRGSLRGAQLELRGLAEAERQAVLRVELADGTTVRGVVRPEAGAFVVPERSAWHATVSASVALGGRHFAAGLDHLLFVLGLVLLARELRRTALAVTHPRRARAAGAAAVRTQDRGKIRTAGERAGHHDSNRLRDIMVAVVAMGADERERILSHGCVVGAGVYGDRLRRGAAGKGLSVDGAGNPGGVRGRVVIFDVWKLETTYRMLSFLVLGFVLVALGFIYNKYQDKIRQWL